MGATKTTDVRRYGRMTVASPSVYFDVIEPRPEVSRPWVVMVHGGAHTGTCYLTTPEGRPGWSDNLVARGFRIAVPDWPGSGRSAPVDLAELDGEAVSRGLAGVIAALEGPVVLLTHSMSGAYGWRLIELCGDRLSAVVAVAPAPPGNIQPEPEVIDRGDDFVEVQALAMQRRLRLDRANVPSDGFIREKYLGASTRFPMQAFDVYCARLHPVAPRLLFERQNIDGSQLKITEPEGFQDLPVMIVTGAHDIDHSRAVDGAVADWLRRQGARVDYHFLPDDGIDGNGHMMMQEDNSAEIAALIADWIDDRTLAR